MSRKRVQDLTDFSYGAAGTPRWHTDRMVEIAVAKSADIPAFFGRGNSSGQFIINP